MNNKYPEYILCILRESVDTDRYDTKYDEEFNTQWTPNEVFDSVMRYQATFNSTRVKEFVKDIYGIDLDKVNNKEITEN